MSGLIAVIGANGNMGRRYGAILNYLKQSWIGLDLDNTLEQYDRVLKRVSGVIIATPTSTHDEIIRMCLDYGMPILCEKPISTNLAAVECLCLEAEARGVKLQMVNQYRHMGLQTEDRGTSYYDYWNHGRDGLFWDCISVVALAGGNVILDEKSPIWKCTINGRELDVSKMDRAYIGMIGLWLEHPKQDTAYIRHAHFKVAEQMQCSTLRRPLGSLSESKLEVQALDSPTKPMH